MAEILLSLTIIGVVAAITLPSLTGNINERTWNTQRKALYARMSQAISLMPALSGYGTYAAETESSSAVDNATETFLTEGLAKVLKINNICDSKHLQDCGIVASFNNIATSNISMPTTLYGLNNWFKSTSYYNSSYTTNNTKAAAFETQNGESIIAFYNQLCGTESRNSESSMRYEEAFWFPEVNMCVNFIYDLNGNKGPNTIGKDMGIITVFNSVDSIVVAPLPASVSNLNEASNWHNASKACTQSDAQSRLPNIDEASAMLINKTIFNLTDNTGLWSSTPYNSVLAWNIYTNHGYRGALDKNYDRNIRCIKR